MATSWRVLMEPLAADDASETRQLFDGATVRLSRFGPRPSALNLETPSPAQLTLFATFLSRVRSEGDEESRTLGRCPGTVLLRAGREIAFTGALDEFGSPSGWVLEEPAEDEPVEPETAEPDANDGAAIPVDEVLEPSERVLRFDFDSAQFKNVPPVGENELVVTLDARRFRHLEVGVELEIAGQVEATKEVNDMLDVFITRTNPPRRPEPMTVLLTDEQNEPVPGATFRIVSGGELKSGGDRGSADSNGKVEIRPRVGVQSCKIIWTTAGGEHSRDLFVELGDEELALERRLHNLGYLRGAAREDNVRAFQREFRLTETGKLEDIAQALVAWHDRGVLPTLGPEPEIDNEPFIVEGPADAEDRSDPAADKEVV